MINTLLRLVRYLFSGRMYAGQYFVSQTEAFLPQVGKIAREQTTGIIEYEGTHPTGGGFTTQYDPMAGNGKKSLMRLLSGQNALMRVCSDHEVAYLFADGIITPWRMLRATLPNEQALVFQNFVGNRSLEI